MGKVAKKPAKTAAAVKRTAMARLVALEWLRNGGRFPDAWATVTGGSPQPMAQALKDDMPVFLAEVERGLQKAGVDKEQILAMLNAQAMMSPLDFIDDEGRTLTVAELKKLPRHLQAAIEGIKVTNSEKIATTPSGAPILDDDGNPIKVPVQTVEIMLVDKQKATKLMAEIMRWVGSGINININNRTVNFAAVQQRAENRVRSTPIIGHASALVNDDEG